MKKHTAKIKVTVKDLARYCLNGNNKTLNMTVGPSLLNDFAKEVWHQSYDYATLTEALKTIAQYPSPKEKVEEITVPRNYLLALERAADTLEDLLELTEELKETSEGMSEVLNALDAESNELDSKLKEEIEELKS